MTELDTLLSFFDDALRHPWESFGSSTKDLTAKEAQYQDPVYRSEEATEPASPPAGSVLWHLWHLERLYRYYTAVLKDLPDPHVREPEPRPYASLEDVMQRLDEARAEFRGVLSELTPADLELPLKGCKDVAEFVRAVIRHETWHAAQIAVARRLYRAAEATQV